jgi:hypothetical protein
MTAPGPEAASVELPRKVTPRDGWVLFDGIGRQLTLSQRASSQGGNDRIRSRVNIGFSGSRRHIEGRFQWCYYSNT